MSKRFLLRLPALALAMTCFVSAGADSFRVATYNVENYLDQPTESRPHVKSPEARAKICESIRTLNPDVLALEEMGGTNALLELRDSLKAGGLDYPYWELVCGMDTNIHVAVLSKLPIVACHPHTNDVYCSTGAASASAVVSPKWKSRLNTNFTFTLIAAHLKSRRPVPEADESAQRLEEAKILRGIIDARLTNNPNAKLVVLGDFNDVKDSDAVKAIIGRGRFKLNDTRPAERNGDKPANEYSRFDPRNVTWTEYYGKEDTYSRVDYILLSPAMARDWVSKKPTLRQFRTGASPPITGPLWRHLRRDRTGKSANPRCPRIKSQPFRVRHQIRDALEQTARRPAIEHAMVEAQRQVRLHHRHELTLDAVPMRFVPRRPSPARVPVPAAESASPIPTRTFRNS